MTKCSFTACSFYLKQANSKNTSKIFDINNPIIVTHENGECARIGTPQDIFSDFFKSRNNPKMDDNYQKYVSIEYNDTNMVEKENYILIYATVKSGVYGSAAEIVNTKTNTPVYETTPEEAEVRPFFVAIIFPKNGVNLTVNKGIMIFQNNGPLGIKTMISEYMREYLSKNYNLTLVMRTISPSLLVEKVIEQGRLQKIILISNKKSKDVADNLDYGYGEERRVFSKFTFGSKCTLFDKLKQLTGEKKGAYEFQGEIYDDIKVVITLFDRTRTVSFKNIENFSIIESIPDEIINLNGYPDPEKLLEFYDEIIIGYLDEMALHIRRG